MSREAGKGDTPRPVDYEKWSEGYDRIFRKQSVYSSSYMDHSEQEELTQAFKKQWQEKIDKEQEALNDSIAIYKV